MSLQVPGALEPTTGRGPTARAGPGIRRRTRRRRLAWALVTYGALGLALAGASLTFAIGALPTLDAIEAQRAEMVHWLDVTADRIGDVELGAVRGGASIRAAAASARDAASLSDDLAGAMASLRDTSADLSILGTRPLGTLTDDFDRVASRAHALASSMTGLAGSLDANTADFATVSADAAALRLQVSELRDTLAADGGFGGDGSLGRLAVLVLLLILWLAVPAVASLVIGVSWLRATRRPPVDATNP